jgi:hypothetical protein
LAAAEFESEDTVCGPRVEAVTERDAAGGHGVRPNDGLQGATAGVDVD